MANDKKQKNGNGNGKKWTTITKHFEALEGFWQTDPEKPGNICTGFVRAYVTTSEYPFYVLEATENVECVDKEKGPTVVRPGSHFGVSGSKMLDCLQEAMHCEVRITYHGKKLSKHDREYHDYTVEKAVIEDSTIK